MHADRVETASLRAIFDAARHFGLTGDEVWEAVNECFGETGADETVADCLDELVKALAGRILAKQRRSRGGGAPAA